MDNPSKKTKDTSLLVKNIIANMLGLDPSDVHEEDILLEDLHMGPADLTDLTERLSDAGLPISDIRFDEIETVGELLDIVSSEEEI